MHSYTRHKISSKIKKQAIRKYLSGMKVKHIAAFLVKKGVIFAHNRNIYVKYKDKTYSYTYCDATGVIYKWIYQYKKNNFKDISMSKKRIKKSRMDVFKETPLEDVVWIIDAYEEILKEKNINIKKEILEKAKREKKNIYSTCLMIKCGTKLLYRKPRNKGAMQQKEMKKIILDIHDKDLSLGSRGITAAMKHKYCTHHSKNTILKLMHEVDIVPKLRRKYKRFDPKDAEHGLENHVQNNFKSNIWKELVYTDITYIKSPFATSGNFYLNAFIDGFNNEVTGMVISETPSTEFVCTSLQLLPLIY